MRPEEQALAQQHQKNFEIELRKELDMPFPKEFIPIELKMWALLALEHQSLPSLQVDYNTYREIIAFLNMATDKEEITFYEISFLLNCISSATPHQLKEANSSFLEIQWEIKNLTVKWNSIVSPIKERLQRKAKSHIIRGIAPNFKN